MRVNWYFVTCMLLCVVPICSALISVSFFVMIPVFVYDSNLEAMKSLDAAKSQQICSAAKGAVFTASTPLWIVIAGWIVAVGMDLWRQFRWRNSIQPTDT